MTFLLNEMVSTWLMSLSLKVFLFVSAFRDWASLLQLVGALFLSSVFPLLLSTHSFFYLSEASSFALLISRENFDAISQAFLLSC